MDLTDRNRRVWFQNFYILEHTSGRKSPEFISIFMQSGLEKTIAIQKKQDIVNDPKPTYRYIYFILRGAGE